jgi:pimeloyl-ACP methyl ester carboxylesterase
LTDAAVILNNGAPIISVPPTSGRPARESEDTMTDSRHAFRPQRWFAGALFGAVLLCLVGTAARADLIFLKDGYVLQGVLKRESKLEIDPANPRDAFTIPTGHYWVDDGPRRIYFAQSLVGTTEKKVASGEERIVHKNKSTIRDPAPLAFLSYYEDTPWSDNWDRTAKVRIDGGGTKMGQCISVMTPYWTRVDATTTYFWAAGYMTRELGLEQVKRLISAHPEFEEKDRMPEAEKAVRRFRYVDFFTQAGWYEEAENELERIQRDLPSQKAKAEAGLKTLRAMMARDKYEEIKRLHLAGQYEAVQKRIVNFPMETADDKIQGDLREFKQEYESTFEKVGECRKLLEDAAKSVGTENRDLFVDAARSIAQELHPGNLARLETFLGQAKQAARQKAQGKNPDLTPEQVLSLGISGWLLGSAAAENKVETGVKLWRARELVLEVLKTNGATARTKLINGYTALPAKDQAPMDWFVQMIPYLPPAEPDPVTGGGVRTVTVGGVNYDVLLPVEYRHSQSYPVLMVLHEAGEKPAAMISRWSEALAHGYILVAPEWEVGGGGGAPANPFGGGGRGGSYQYSAHEHETVLATLRDLRQRFNIDSDRVFLTGLGQGGSMAFDVGLSHPDLFAGLIPMSGNPDFFTQKYWRNSMYLPCYVVGGERLGDGFTNTKALFDIWILRGQHSIWVQYKGRGVEFLPGEVPLILDWMRAKRRAFPMRQLGNDGGAAGLGMEFQMMRQTDNRFYWITCDQIAPRNTCTMQNFNKTIQPATLNARVDNEQNRIVVKPGGVKQLTIWLARNSKGESTVDFEKPVMVQVGLAVKIPGRKVVPSLAVLLEDLAQRGDRQQLFLAKIDLGF